MKNLFFFLLAFSSISLFVSCSDDEATVELQTVTYNYEMHNGQTVPTAAYAGFHANSFSASMTLDEMENGNTMITVTLNNTVEGGTYNIHAHDAADPATTPNGTPYNEMPNADVFAGSVDGDGGTVTLSQESTMSFEELTSTYEAFFVIHDPLQAVSTTDITTYLVVGSFAREQTATSYESTVFNYDFNTGQVAEAFAYSGMHEDNLSAVVEVTELADGTARVAVRIENSVSSATYNTHAHDMADPMTTPNGTPYDETPNADVFAGPIIGNGKMTGASNISSMSYTDITTSYDGFFVIHDPLQDLSTTDPTTYVVLGVFAR